MCPMFCGFLPIEKPQHLIEIQTNFSGSRCVTGLREHLLVNPFGQIFQAEAVLITIKNDVLNNRLFHANSLLSSRNRLQESLEPGMRSIDFDDQLTQSTGLRFISPISAFSVCDLKRVAVSPQMGRTKTANFFFSNCSLDLIQINTVWHTEPDFECYRLTWFT